MSDGKITDCASAGCGWRCCQFQQGNFIALYPGELEAAWQAGKSTTHLTIIDDDYNGGKKVVCTARDTGTCDNGFKPLDCVSYPFFPAPPGNEEADLLIKGKKCPLAIEHLGAHADLVREAWGEVMMNNPAVRPWLNKVRMVGYTEPMIELDLKFQTLLVA